MKDHAALIHSLFLLSLLFFHLLPPTRSVTSLLSHLCASEPIKAKHVVYSLTQRQGHQRLSLGTVCVRHVKRRRMGKRVLHYTSLFFFSLFSNQLFLFLWLNAAENWMAWQSRGGCFPRRRVRMEHIPGESCANPSIDLVRNPPDLWNTLADQPWSPRAHSSLSSADGLFRLHTSSSSLPMHGPPNTEPGYQGQMGPHPLLYSQSPITALPVCP